MAIVITGHTRCAICDEILKDNEEIGAFSAFIANRLDPLYLFNDAAFHRACFDRHPLAARATAIDKRLNENSKNRVCSVCHNQITSPDDYFVTGYLSEVGPLAEFNYLQMHESCLTNWPGCKRFEQALDTAVAHARLENEYTVRYLKEALSL